MSVAWKTARTHSSAGSTAKVALSRSSTRRRRLGARGVRRRTLRIGDLDSVVDPAAGVSVRWRPATGVGLRHEARAGSVMPDAVCISVMPASTSAMRSCRIGHLDAFRRRASGGEVEARRPDRPRSSRASDRATPCARCRRSLEGELERLWRCFFQTTNSHLQARQPAVQQGARFGVVEIRQALLYEIHALQDDGRR